MSNKPAKQPETDPNGLAQHAPGAKLDAGKNRLSMVLFAFSRAIEAVGRCGTFGAAKYTDGGWQFVPNGEQRYTDALLRHLMREGQGETHDPDSELPHATHAAWNSLARLELILRRMEQEQKEQAQAETLKQLDRIVTRDWRRRSWNAL
jgi:hypothetical protein